MNPTTALLALLVSLAANASATESFGDRVLLAKDAERRDEFKQYQATMFSKAGEHLAKTMRACFDKTPDPDAQAFVLVADISPHGEAQAVEVKPQTNIANCFAAGFAAAEYPTPPTYPQRRGFPVVIEMSVKP